MRTMSYISSWILGETVRTLYLAIIWLLPAALRNFLANCAFFHLSSGLHALDPDRSQPEQVTVLSYCAVL